MPGSAHGGLYSPGPPPQPATTHAVGDSVIGAITISGSPQSQPNLTVAHVASSTCQFKYSTHLSYWITILLLLSVLSCV